MVKPPIVGTSFVKSAPPPPIFLNVGPEELLKKEEKEKEEKGMNDEESTSFVKSPPPPPIFLNVGPEFNTHAVEEWIQGALTGPARKTLSISVMRHLCHIGWRIHYYNNVHYLTPPTGGGKNMFTNLLDACIYLKNKEEELVNKEEKEKEEKGINENDEEYKEEQEEKDKTYVYCYLCKNLGGNNNREFFCAKWCLDTYILLRQLIYKSISTNMEDTTWTLVQVDRKRGRENQDPRIASAYGLLVKAFGKRFSNMLDRIVYSTDKFSGFYTACVLKNNQMASVATFRVHTNGYIKIAEVPFVTTARKYRGQHLCNSLMSTLEDILTKLGVNEIILPSVTTKFSMWNEKFGFTLIGEDKEELIFGTGDIDIVNFRDTLLCAKTLNPVK
ncbi:hypothetical protein TSUD_315930 [Trifolium subterraneum]|uniref:N-acetyltransferase domain-containing protein n=1 Tax=Trifolium subterraneum TaxID=3900 RepID=A0A2Z6MGX7_TRISU|nr:hypothetical protein TSUD_315930 [Trifolium subterraneum]